MLLFIKRRSYETHTWIRIQIHLMLLFIRSFRKVKGQKEIIQIHLMLLFIMIFAIYALSSLLFKYISCYYLSGSGKSETVTKFVFKYISCYYLSTSSCTMLQLTRNSNTSHVIIYLTLLISLSKTSTIQIHLMLLFILLHTTQKIRL